MTEDYGHGPEAGEGRKTGGGPSRLSIQADKTIPPNTKRPRYLDWDRSSTCIVNTATVAPLPEGQVMVEMSDCPHKYSIMATNAAGK